MFLITFRIWEVISEGVLDRIKDREVRDNFLSMPSISWKSSISCSVDASCCWRVEMSTGIIFISREVEDRLSNSLEVMLEVLGSLIVVTFSSRTEIFLDLILISSDDVFLG